MSKIERRIGATVLEVRDDDADGITLTGYASTFDDPYSMGWYTETVDRNAFKRTLGRSPDVRLLVNHADLPLARTASGTLMLDTDSKGLRVQTSLDPSDPDVARLTPKLKRGDLNQMSFAFRVFDEDGDSWSKDMSSRTLRSLDLDDGDVSVVTYPANPNASVGLRAVGPVTESIASALRTLEERGASEEDVVDVLARALACFRGDLPTLRDLDEMIEEPAPHVADVYPQAEQEPRDATALLKARARRLALLG